MVTRKLCRFLGSVNLLFYYRIKKRRRSVKIPIHCTALRNLCVVKIGTKTSEDVYFLFESQDLSIRNGHGSCMFGDK